MIRQVFEISIRYLDLLGDSWPLMTVLFLIPLVLLLLARKYSALKSLGDSRWSPWITRILLSSFILIGLTIALRQASVVDDAFISFRYARNLAEGHGLVFNPGEPVEGYTNFLWTVLIALSIYLTSLDAPTVSLILSLSCFVANLIVVCRIGRILANRTKTGFYIPLAAMLLSLQTTFCAFATTGMEAMAASLLVNLGVLFLVAREDAKGAALSGLMFILATMTRPDHSLFYIAAGIAVLLRSIESMTDAVQGSARRTRCSGLFPVIAYALPFAGYLVYLGWKLAYYGSFLPNTFYAKAMDLPYYDQGLVYAATFYLGSHFWIVAICFFCWLFIRSKESVVKQYKYFAAIAFVFWNLFILRIGGDFMYGRFYVSLMPLLLLGGEALIYSRRGKSGDSPALNLTLAKAAVAGLLAATAFGTQIIEHNKPQWLIQEPSSFYRVSQLYPLEIHHVSYIEAKFFHAVLVERGIKPTIAAPGIGMIGFYSRLPLIDTFGLTDSVIAHRDVEKHARPGHEKSPTDQYLIERGVRFVWTDEYHPKKYRHLTTLALENIAAESWLIFIYDRELMRTIKNRVPEIGFVDFEQYLDRYIAELDLKKRETVSQDLRWFKKYYFDHNDDSNRMAILESHIRD